MKKEATHYCKFCKEPLPPSTKEKRGSYCDLNCYRAQQKIYMRTYRKKHLGLLREKQKSRYVECQEMIEGMKKGPCVLCGGSFAGEAMTFMHRPDETKVCEVERAFAVLGGKTQILAEISKCDLVCRNCRKIV